MIEILDNLDEDAVAEEMAAILMDTNIPTYDMFDDLVMAYENGNDDFRKGMNEVLMIITYKNVPELVEHMKKIVEEEEEN